MLNVVNNGIACQRVYLGLKLKECFFYKIRPQNIFQSQWQEEQNFLPFETNGTNYALMDPLDRTCEKCNLWNWWTLPLCLVQMQQKVDLVSEFISLFVSPLVNFNKLYNLKINERNFKMTPFTTRLTVMGQFVFILWRYILHLLI